MSWQWKTARQSNDLMPNEIFKCDLVDGQEVEKLVVNGLKQLRLNILATGVVDDKLSAATNSCCYNEEEECLESAVVANTLRHHLSWKRFSIIKIPCKYMSYVLIDDKLRLLGLRVHFQNHLTVSYFL